MAFIKIKFASKIFLAFLSLSVILQSIASAELLSNGLPPHSLGYADKHGYLLYTDKLFDLHLTNPDSEGNEYIPIRIAFYTSPLYRKKLRLLKNGDYSIEWKNSDTSEQLIYAPNGLLKKISFKIKGKAYAYNIYRTKDSLIIRDLHMKTVFQIEKRPSSQDGFKSEITLKSGENLFVWHTRDAKIYSGNSADEIETVFKFERCDKEFIFDYESDKNRSKMVFSSQDSKKPFEWDSQNGFIRKDWLGEYSIKRENEWHIRVVRTTSWATLSFEDFSDRGIYCSGYNDFVLKRFIIGGNHSLSGLTRRIEIFKKGESKPSKVLRYFYDQNGKETIRK